MPPKFNQTQHILVAKIIGSMPKTVPDHIIQEITETFGRAFSKDSWYFSFTKFQSMVTRQREE